MNVVLPEVAPVVVTEAVAVPISLPAVAGVVSSSVLAGGGGSPLMRLLSPERRQSLLERFF